MTTLRIFLVGLVVVTTACSRPLPEKDSLPAQLYAQQCGGCHAVYPPHLLTARMWETMVGRMEVEMRRRGRPLAEPDKQMILSYLRRNAAVR